MIRHGLLKHKKILIILLLTGVVFILLYSSIIQPAIRPQSFRTGSQFLIGIRLNGQIRNPGNATFLLPLPVHNGTPHLGTKSFTEENFRREGYSVSLVEQKGGVYVKISIPSLAPAGKDVYLVEDSYFEFPPSDSEFRPINTRNPVGNEPVFLPRINSTFQKPGSESSSTWYGANYNPVITGYQIPVYAEYSAPNNTGIEIFGWIKGTNRWAELGTYLDNSYQDSYRLLLNGSSDGWYLADGRMESGEGKYLDA